MKSILFVAMLVIGIASCETPQPATGTTDDTNQSGTMGAGSTTTGTSGTSTDSSTTGTSRDTTTTRRDSLPK